MYFNLYFCWDFTDGSAFNETQAVQRFAVADLSNWYLDVIKDRLYVSAANSFDRRAAQTVLHSLVQVHLLRNWSPAFLAHQPMLALPLFYALWACQACSPLAHVA